MSASGERPRVVVIGLGPGSPAHVTVETLDEIERVPLRFVRTRRHPSAHLVPDAVSFDELYESADTYADVYTELADRIVRAAIDGGEVLYAVPGSPLVLERSVRQLVADDRVECTVLPALSFLDVAYARLGIDPVEVGLRLVDGHDFAVAAAGERGPLLVAHAHADWVLSDIKLAVEDASGDEEVVILQRLGTPDEAITRTTWAELDRTVEPDHLTALYIPRLATPVGAEYVRFHQLARILREQCPWDIEQTHRTLIPYVIEETYELVDALESLTADDPTSDEHVIEELGDLLYQIEFHATIAEQEGRFTIADVARGVHDKLVRRHPHVFGDTVVDGTETVLRNWDAIKRAEKGHGPTFDGRSEGVFDGIPGSFPSLSYAHEVQKKAAKLGFDWPDVGGALAKIVEEAAELGEAAVASEPDAVRDELGDLLFAVVNVARHLAVDPESALRAAAQKFRARFEAVEALARARDIELASVGLDQLDALWEQVKLDESH
ncbi:MAG TPA: nucleoside triphosphate pyrophosphohydrolase [Ilumatobacteraceae bacterium]|nr:nucleoside triphosphate pyrophosphohydrolase [Ilumatobacteraceae bacterium]